MFSSVDWGNLGQKKAQMALLESNRFGQLPCLACGQRFQSLRLNRLYMTIIRVRVRYDHYESRSQSKDVFLCFYKRQI